MKLKSAALALAVALAGCSLARQELPSDDSIPRIGGGGIAGEHIVPPQCVLRIVIATRPVGDQVLGESVWRVADEQAVDADVRRVLQANGLRVGLTSGELPQDVLDVLAATRPRRAEDHTVVLPDGDPTLIDPSTPASSERSILLGLNGKLVGKDYQDAKGLVRVTASLAGEDGVALRIVPEVHHGPIQRGWDVTGGGTSMTPRQLITREGQKEDAFREMASTLVVKPGQVVVLGGLHEKRGSLGDFLFGEPEGHGDIPLGKVVFLWATRAAPEPSEDPPVGLVPFEPEAEVKSDP